MRTEETQNQIHFGVSDLQKHLIQKAADLCDISLAQFCREAVRAKSKAVFKAEERIKNDNAFMARQVAANPSTQVKQ